MRLPLPASPPRALVRAALALRAALQRAADAVVPAQYAVFELGVGLARTQLLHVVARLRIADLLEEGPQDAAALAARCGASADALGRALRALASYGVFAQRGDGAFENNRLSEALRGGASGSMRDFAEYMGSGSNVRAWADVDRTIATGRNAFERVHGTTVWEWFARHPDEGRTFAEAMGRLTELDAAAIAAGYPWGRHARICDVGGSRGVLLAEILRRHPRPSGVLLDAPGVVALAPPLLAARGVAGRVEVRGGDLFEAVPEGCDAYLLKDVLHDWDDAACGRILAACRRAARPGARVLVVEILVEPGGPTMPPGPIVDVQMMTVTCEGRQRSRAELGRLLARSGFRLEEVVEPGSPFSVVAGVAV
jgi:hypothetical protein